MGGVSVFNMATRIGDPGSNSHHSCFCSLFSITLEKIINQYFSVHSLVAKHSRHCHTTIDVAEDTQLLFSSTLHPHIKTG